jgi:hypothetical protein
MKICFARILPLLLGLTMCGFPDKPKPEEKMSPIRWVEVSALSRTFLIARIAERGKLPFGEFEDPGPFEGSGGHAGETLFRLYLPNAAAQTTVSLARGGRSFRLPKPRYVFRMPNSPLYTEFFLNPSMPGTLVFSHGGKTDSVRLDAHLDKLKSLPFFWSGDPPSVASEELPGWLNGTLK